MTHQELQLAAERAYQDNDDAFDEHNPSLRLAFIEGAKHVLSEQAKGKENLRKEFSYQFSKGEDNHDLLIALIWRWIESHLNTYKEESIGTVSEWQLCPKCNGAGRLINAYTTTDIYSQCDVCNGAKTLVKPLVYPDPVPNPPAK